MKWTTLALVSLAVFGAACARETTNPAGAGSAAALAVRPAAAEGEGEGTGAGGRLVFYSKRDGNAEIYVKNADGTEPRRITDDPAEDIWPDLSPNGRYVAFASNRSGNREIYVADLNGGRLVNVSQSPADDNWPRWSPDGREIAFHSNRDGKYEIYVANADGTGAPRRVTNSALLDQWPDWSPDGRHIAFRRGTDVYVIDADGEEQNPRQLTNSGGSLNQMAVWSPDGKRLAFMSQRAGYCAVFLMDADGDTPADPAMNLTPKDPGDANASWCSRAPAWSRNGRQIYFMSARPSTAGDAELFVMNADGSNQTRLTFSPGEDGGPRAR